MSEPRQRDRRRIALAGSVAQKPAQGGHTWVFLQYLLGLRRLGFDVLFIDRLNRAACHDDAGRPLPRRSSEHLRYFASVMERFGLAGAYSLLGEGEEVLLGRDRDAVVAALRDSELLLNVMGFLDDEELLAAAPRRVFLDIDPGFPQMWCELGWADVFAGHEDFVTVGRNLGRESCTIPSCGLRWIPTLPPIVLDLWPTTPVKAAAFTSIGTWRGRYDAVDFGGQRYGLRVHAFRDLVRLPRLSRGRFELALAIDPSETGDLRLLRDNGWHLVDPRRVAADPERYRSYIAASAGELMIAKDTYARSRSGWFSDRSACYLASGRPVVAHDTGFSDHLPTGDGLLAFSSLAEAADAVERISRDPGHHARAARRLAEEHFDSDHVLSGLLQDLGVAA